MNTCDRSARFPMIPWAAPDAATVEPGTTVVVSGRVEVEGDVSEHHVVHCEVVRPDGSRPFYWARNLDAPQGRFRVEIPLALNAARGTWRVELSDVASGASGEAVFSVR